MKLKREKLTEKEKKGNKHNERKIKEAMIQSRKKREKLDRESERVRVNERVRRRLDL